MVIKKPLILPILFSYLVGSNAWGNNVLKIIEGELVSKTDTSIIVKTGKTSHEEVVLSAIGSVMVLDGRKLLDGWERAAVLGLGAGGSLSVVDSPRNIRRTGKLMIAGMGIILVLRAGYNYVTRKPAILVYDANQPGYSTELIGKVALGAKIRITYKNHH